MESIAVLPSGVANTVARHRPLLFTIFMFWLIGLVDKFAFSTILTDKGFLTDLHLKGHATTIGVLVSIAVLAQAAGNGIFGWAVDRFGPRRSAVVGVLGWAASCVLAALAGSVAILVVSRLILGLSEGYTWPVGNALTARWFPKDRRAKARGLWMSAVTIGPGISGFFTAGLLGAMSWQGVFWVLGAISVVVCLPLILLFVRDVPPGGIPEESAAERATAKTSQFAGLARRGFWLATLGASGTSIAVWALASWLPTYLKDAQHVSKEVYQYYILAAYAVGLVVMLLWSRVVDRLRHRAVWLAGALWTSAALFLVIGEVPGAPALLLIVLIVAIIYGISLLFSQGFQDQMTTAGRVGTENGSMNMVSNILAGVVPFAMGGLIDLDSGSYSVAFLFLFLLLGVCGASALAMHRRGY